MKRKVSTSSIYRGVSWNNEKKLWKVTIQYNKDRIFIGLFPTEEEAALAYNEKAIALGGPNTIRLNVIEPLCEEEPALWENFTEEEFIYLAQND